MTFSAAELTGRRERAVAAMEAAGLDALVISLKEHMTYLTGTTFHDLQQHAVGLLTADGALSLWFSEPALAGLEDEGDARAPRLDIVPAESPARAFAGLIAALRQSAARHVGYEGDWYALRWSELAALRAVGDLEWHEATHVLTQLRLVKSSEEVAVLRRAAVFADAGMEAAVAATAVGVRELDVAAAAQERITRAGSEYSSFPGLVGAGPRSGLYHPLPTERRLRAGDGVEIEVTGALRRYNSNLVRTVFVGRASPAQRDLYAVVHEAFHAGVDAVAPGTAVGVVDDATRRVRARYARYIPSRAGYGIELSYPPFLTGALSILSGAPHVFEPGMVFSLEPSIAGYEHQTVILGCNVLVTAGGAEILHRFPRDLLVVG